MSTSNPGYLAEIEREQLVGMPACRCSNCEPQAAARIIQLLPQKRSEDLEELLRSSPNFPEDITPLQPNKKVVKRKATAGIPEVCKRNNPIRLIPAMKDLAVSLIDNFEEIFTQTYPSGCHMQSRTLFKLKDAWQIVKNYDSVLNGVFLREILGGQHLPGHFDTMTRCIQKWLRSDSFHSDQKELEDLQIENNQDILDLELVEDHHCEESRLKVAEQAAKDAAIAERKRIRQEKSVEAERLKADKREHRQKEIEL